MPVRSLYMKPAIADLGNEGHGCLFRSRSARGREHTRWLWDLQLEHPARCTVLAEYRQTIAGADRQLKHLNQQVTQPVPVWSVAPMMAAYQVPGGAPFLTSVMFFASTYDVRPFKILDTSLQLSPEMVGQIETPCSEPPCCGPQRQPRRKERDLLERCRHDR